MATVVITCFAIRFHDYKMDAECEGSHRDFISRREKRWSMNSQRLEEIVAELMKPISDVRRSFDTDLSALLEEYLTEAGLRALEEGEEEDGEWQPAEAEGGPNFAELALLLQHSASIYGRKVDFLYQHVLSVSDSLHNNSTEESAEMYSPTEGSSEPRRKRGAGAGADAGGFAAILLEECAGCKRDSVGRPPPPTLPRLYLELEPRALTAGDAPLVDYAGEPIGLLEDFHVGWRLQRGLLTERVAARASPPPPPLRALPLHQIQAAIEAAAPPPTPRPDTPRSVSGTPTPLETSPAVPETPTSVPETPMAVPETPTAVPETPAAVLETPEAVTVRQQRKRKCGADFVLATNFSLAISNEGGRALSLRREFSVCGAWTARVLQRRRQRLLRLRARALHVQRRHCKGFIGWSSEEAERAVQGARELAARLHGAVEAATTTTATAGGCDSDDDGFFEQSSLGDSDTSRIDDALQTVCTPEWVEWSAGVATRALEGAGPDVRALANSVLAAAPASPAPPRPFRAVLRALCSTGRDVSRLLLATLFLANAGAVELQGSPLTVGQFTVRASGRGEGAAAAAAAAELQLGAAAAGS